MPLNRSSCRSFAWAIATIVLPLVSWFNARGVPRILAVLVVTVLLVTLFACLLMLLSTPVAYWLGAPARSGPSSRRSCRR